MKIDDLIEMLQKVRKEKGNVEVVCNSFCGTNNAHAFFVIEPWGSQDVNDHINGLGEFCLVMAIAPACQEKTIKDIDDMNKLGYTFYRSQFVEKGQMPRMGLSICPWHVPW